jgi:molybdopterin synthase catalytic subunit
MMSGSVDWIEITAEALPVGDAVAFVTDPDAGAVDVFLGTTRAERHPESGVPLVALDYESYAEMALPQLRTLAAAARSQWPVLKLAILHRTGRVALGEPSVVIAVSTPHRTDAFAACQFLITALKADVAVWKKEVWADGSASWVHPGESTTGHA